MRDIDRHPLHVRGRASAGKPRRSRSVVATLALTIGPAVSLAGQQTAADEYTRYELLAPETGKFRIYYDVSATTPGARYFFNPIRKGSEASDEAVYDRVTGAPLEFTVVDGATARAGGHPTADLETQYIRVELPRPVPRGGEIRILIDKTYRDTASYYLEGDEIVFARSLGIRRNAVVLPAGYELIRCNVPAQVLTDAQGRIFLSFINAGPGAVSLAARARKLGR